MTAHQDSESRRTVVAHWLGRVPYEQALALQEELHAARIEGLVGDTILFLEHPPVLTLGRGANPAHVLMSDEQRAAEGLELHDTGRGGDVTYHGPGQLVAYPIVDLAPDRRDVRRYVRDLAEVMVLLARDHGIGAGVVEGIPKYVGVWVDAASPAEWTSPALDAEGVPLRAIVKLGAIGVRISRWCTMHGFALNVATNLNHFRAIVPCGIEAAGVASLETLGVRPPQLADVAARACEHFARVFSASVEFRSPATVDALSREVAAARASRGGAL